ncbi:MAG: alanine racemase C-terminal domain-containing protein [Solirubrobacterales bacterium]
MVGIVPIGLADGYRASRGAVPRMLLRGRRVPVVDVYHQGASATAEATAVKPSLHYTMLDLTEVPDARVGEEVVVLGSAGGQEVRIEEIAAWQGTSPLEVLTSISSRAPFRYLPAGGR